MEGFKRDPVYISDAHRGCYSLRQLNLGNEHSASPPLGFPGGSVKNYLPAKEEDTGSIPRLGTSPGEGIGDPLLPRKFHEQRSLVGYSPWGHKRVRHDLATQQQQIPPLVTPVLVCQGCCNRTATHHVAYAIGVFCLYSSRGRNPRSKCDQSHPPSEGPR